MYIVGLSDSIVYRCNVKNSLYGNWEDKSIIIIIIIILIKTHFIESTRDYSWKLTTETEIVFRSSNYIDQA